MWMSEWVEFHPYLEELKTVEENGWTHSKMFHLEILCRMDPGNIAYCCLSSPPLASKKKRV